MVSEILTAAGVLHARASFPRLPAETCAVYFDDLEVITADRVTPPTSAGLPRIYKHNVTIELYAPMQDDAIETAIEDELDARGLEWEKQDRYWLKDSQRYQTVYGFTYTSKTK